MIHRQSFPVVAPGGRGFCRSIGARMKASLRTAKAASPDKERAIHRGLFAMDSPCFSSDAETVRWRLQAILKQKDSSTPAMPPLRMTLQRLYYVILSKAVAEGLAKR